jgi:hypothetical protein
MTNPLRRAHSVHHELQRIGLTATIPTDYDALSRTREACRDL